MPKIQKKNRMISATREEDLNTVGNNPPREGRYARIAGYNLRHFVKCRRSKFAKLLMSKSIVLNGRSKNSIATPLHFAVMNRNIESVRVLIDRGARVNAEDRKGSTPLHYAIRSIRTRDIALLLLHHGANIYTKNDFNETPFELAIQNGSIHIFREYLQHSTATVCRRFNILHTAIAYDHTDTVKWLLSEDIDINMQDESGKSPLYIAVEGNHIEIAKLLLEREASLNSVNASRNYYALIHVARQEGLNEMVELLLQKIVSAARNEITPIHIATSSRNYDNDIYDTIKMLKNHNANDDTVDGTGNIILDLAVRNGDLPLVDEFLSRSPDINDYSNKKLFITAVKSRSKKIIKLFLERGFDVNAPDAEGYPGLHYIAVSNGSPFENDLCARVDVAKLLLKEGADINSTNDFGSTTLHLVILNKCEPDIVQFLLENGANVNLKDYRGRTPLHFAALYGTRKVCKLLLRAGADVNSRDDKLTGLYLANRNMRNTIVRILLEYGVDIHSNNEDGWTPLHFSALHGEERICSLFLDSGADVNAKNPCKYTALHLAVHAEQKNIVQILLKRGVLVNSQTKYGHTALHLAAKYGHVQIIEMLLNFRADIESVDNNGDTALDLASHAGHEEAVRILIKMHVLSLPRNKENVMDLNIVPIMRRHTELVWECMIEAAIMEHTGIEYTDLTVHDILTKGINQLASHARNEDNVRVWRQNDYEKIFPEYGRIIQNCFNKLWNERS